MQLRQLEYFVAVAEEANFTRAADRVHVAQPGVSAQVRRLERELGAELLDRSGRLVRPTEAGRALLPHARAALGAVGAARNAIAELDGLLRGRIAMGMVTACSSLDLTDLLAGFHRDHPGVELALDEANSDDLTSALLAGELDLAFIGLGPVNPLGLELHVVADEAVVAAVAPDHPLAGRTSVTLRRVGTEPLVSMPSGTGVRHAFESACRRAGIQPHVAFEASDPRVVAQLAARGLGVGILPESTAASQPKNLHPVRLTPQLRTRLALAWPSDGPASRAAAELVRRGQRELPLAA